MSTPTEQSRTPSVSMSEQLTLLYQSCSQVLAHGLRLLALESRLAALSLSAMLGLAILVALLLCSAWLFTLLALSFWLVESGVMGWGLALISSALVNIALSFVLMFLLRQLSANLMFSRTRKQLGLSGETAYAHSD